MYSKHNTLRSLFLASLFGFFCLTVSGQTTDLIISEYSESNATFNNWIELYNGTGASINLADYQIVRHQGGGTGGGTLRTLSLSGMLANGSTYLITPNNSTNTTVKNAADLLVPNGPTVLAFMYNGAEAIVLQKNISGSWTNIDVIGGTAAGPYAVGATTNGTQDHVLVRDSTVCGPETDWVNTGNLQWNVLALNTTSNIGTHTANCAVSASISIDSLSNNTTTFCIETTQPDTVDVVYTATGTYNVGNQFTVELSDASGSFASPVSLGNITSTAASGTIQAIVPGTTGTGTGYRIRVVSSNPVLTGSDNGIDLTVGSIPSLSSVISNVSCNNGSDGSIDLTVANGSAPFSFAWSNAMNTEDLTGLAAATFTTTVTDANGCDASDSFSVTEPTVISASASVVDASCGVSDGSIDLTVSGGTPGYTFGWSNGASTEDISTLAAGTYTVTITDNANCQVTPSFPVSNTAAVSSSDVVADVNCNGGSDGSIDITVIGGTPPFTYLWSNGSNNQDITGLSATTYTLTITDSVGCTDISSYVVNEPALLSVSGVATDAACNAGSNGTVDITVSGGTSGYTFLWSNGAMTEDLSGLQAGPYTVTVTDANACTVSGSYSVSEPTAINPTAVTVDATCNGGSNGSIDLSVSGGTAGYTYAWSNSAVTQDISGLSATTYTATVTDANGCTASANFSVSEPLAIAVNPTLTHILCNGDNTGAISTAVSGGAFPYQYNWSTGSTSPGLTNRTAATYTLTVTDANACTSVNSYALTQPAAIAVSGIQVDVTCPGGNDGAINLSASGGIPPYTFQWSNTATTEDVSGLAAGVYTVVVMDSASCNANGAFVLTEPAPIAAAVSIDNITCNGAADGNIDITPSGGTAPYTYLWSNTSTNEDLTNVAAGSYTATITDANACVGTVTYILTEPMVLAAAGQVTSVLCNGGTDGSIDLTVNGGTSPYTFDWSNGGNSEDLTGIAAGMYTVTVLDSNLCVTNVSLNVTQPAPLGVTPALTDVTCYDGADGSIDLTVNGGTPGYTFAWSNGQTQEDINGLTAGTYTGTITDDNGCTASESFTLIQPDSISVTFQVSDIFCTTCSGSITATATGGNGSFLYNWSNGDSGDNIVVSDAGTYTVTITDARGCTKTRSVFVDMTLSTNEINTGGSQISVYPNPASSLLNIQWQSENGTSQEVIFSVWSVDGKEVYRSRENTNGTQAGGPVLQLDVAAWNAGMYILQVMTDNQQVLGHTRFIVSD